MPRRRPPPKPKRRPRGTGSLSVASDGTIRARLPSAINKRRTAREFRPGQLAEATAWLDSFVFPQILSAVPETVTLHWWINTWWETYVEPIRPPNTSKWYRYALRQLQPLYETLLPDLRPSALQGVVGTLVGRVDAATVQGVVGVWRRCLEAAIDDEHLTRNPAKRLTVPKATKRPPARHVTADEIAVLWPAIRGKRFEAAYAIILGCGLRIGEVLGLHWRHVDFDARRIWVETQFTNGHWRPLPKAANPHHVPMPPAVMAALMRHQKTQPEGSTLVMQSPHRGKLTKRERAPRPWSRNAVAADLAEIVKALGLDGLTPHAGRHGLATHLMEHGVSPPVIAERLGNSPGVVLSTYGHATPGGRKQADELVDTYLLGDVGADLAG